MMKLGRQSVIMEIISERDIETQNQLMEALAERGVKSTQATLSRDIRDMRLVKELGPKGNYRYVAASKQETPDLDIRLKKIFKECVVSCDIAQNIIVLHTYAGMAQAVALEVDHLSHSGILGCVAGDDTIIIVARDNAGAVALGQEMHELIRSRAKSQEGK